MPGTEATAFAIASRNCGNPYLIFVETARGDMSLCENILCALNKQLLLTSPVAQLTNSIFLMARNLRFNFTLNSANISSQVMSDTEGSSLCVPTMITGAALPLADIECNL